MNVGGLGIGSAFVVSVLFTYNLQDNPLLWRVFSPSSVLIGPGNHHTSIMILFAVAFFGSVRYGIAPFIAMLGVYMAVELYEAQWYIFYVASKMIYGGQFSWNWLIITVLIFPIAIWYSRRFGFPRAFWSFMLPMFTIWFLFGFPITQDFPAHTALYLNLKVNAWEFLTHCFSFLGFALFEWPILKSYSKSLPKWHL